MTQRTVVWILALLWAAAWGGSFVAFAITDPTGDSFTRGLNRLMAFLGWQLAAGFLGGLVWMAGRGLAATPLGRWLTRVPALLAIVLFGALAATVLWTRMAAPPPGALLPPATATTKPAETN